MQPTVPKDLMVNLGRVVRRRRLEARLGQEEFSEMAGMHRTTCSLIERGRQSPTIVMLSRIATALGTSMASLIDELERPKGQTDTEPSPLPSGRKTPKKR